MPSYAMVVVVEADTVDAAWDAVASREATGAVEFVGEPWSVVPITSDPGDCTFGTQEVLDQHPAL